MAHGLAITDEYPILISIAVTNMMANGNLERKDLFFLRIVVYTAPSESFFERSQGKNSGWNLEAGTEAEPMEEPCLLNCSLWCTQPAFLELQDLQRGLVLARVSSDLSYQKLIGNILHRHAHRLI